MTLAFFAPWSASAQNLRAGAPASALQYRTAGSGYSLLAPSLGAPLPLPGAPAAGVSPRLFEPGVAPAVAPVPAAAKAVPHSVMPAAAAARAPNRTAASPLATVAAAKPAGAAETADFGSYFDGSAGFLENLRLDAPPPAKGGAFVVPNERHPKDMRPILEKSPGGAYVTVGTERGFIAAALAPAITHLVLADIDPAVYAYNRVNVALLRLARTREEYAELRESAPHRRWVEAARERGMTELLPILGDAGAFKEWRKHQRRNLSASRLSRAGDAWHRFVRDRLPWLAPNEYGEENRRPEFEEVNYLRDEALFAKVKALADGGRIRPLIADLGDGRTVGALAGALARSGVPLGTLDLSNVWDSVYLKARAVITLVESFGAVAARDSILLVTEGGSGTLGYTGPSPWLYFGFRFADIASRPDPEGAIRDIFAYNMRGYAPNAMNAPALPNARPTKPAYKHDLYPTYWWQENRIEPRTAP